MAANQFDPGMPQTHFPIPERESYYPSWGPSFSEHLNLVLIDREGNPYIKADGEPVTVQDVLVERRWAIDYETGGLMDERDFRDAHTLWITFICTPRREVIPMRSVNPHFTPELEPIPNVDDFVLHREQGGRLDWGEQHARVFKPQKAIDPALLATMMSESRAAGYREGVLETAPVPAAAPAPAPVPQAPVAVAPEQQFPENAPPPKRGRGRPRKHPLPAPAPE